MRYNRACANDSTGTHCDAPENRCSGCKPDIIANIHRFLSQVNAVRMAEKGYLSKMAVSKFSGYWMCLAVKNIDIMGDNNTITDSYRG